MYFSFLWAVTWTTIRSVGKSRLSYPDYQVLFTCKSVTGYLVYYMSHLSIQSMRSVTIFNFWPAAYLIITTYQGLFLHSSPNCQIYWYCMVSYFLEHKYFCFLSLKNVITITIKISEFIFFFFFFSSWTRSWFLIFLFL